jgi:hypothetical protein
VPHPGSLQGGGRKLSIIAPLWRFLAGFLPLGWQLRAAPVETTVAASGMVEIRRILSACIASTCVTGEPAQARETALRRLTRYLNGENFGTVRLKAERLIVQQQVGSRRWQISVRLCPTENGIAAPRPRAPKVKLYLQQVEFLAVKRMTGRPAHNVIAGADASLLDTIASSNWAATGAPMIRLHPAGPFRWLKGEFEVAVPVVPRLPQEALGGNASARPEMHPEAQ